METSSVDGKHEEAIEKYMEAVVEVAIGDSPSDEEGIY